VAGKTITILPSMIFHGIRLTSQTWRRDPVATLGKAGRRTGQLVAVAGVVTAMALLVPPAVAAGSSGVGGRMQADVDAVAAAGAVGVLATRRTEKGRTVARSGVADLKTSRPLPWSAYFRIGSTSKTFTATVALQLVGEGKMHLTDTVDGWLPGTVTGNGNDGSRITLGNLLRHTSGLNDWNNEVPIAKDPTPARYLKERFRI
jgi:D-alanyl-D-alanine carboxypeptidase